MTISRSQLLGIFGVLGVSVLMAFVAKDATGQNLMLAILAVGVLAAGILAFNSGGAGGANVGALADDVRRAATGDRPSPPGDATPEVRRIYDELATLVERRKKDEDEIGRKRDEVMKTARTLDKLAEELMHTVDIQATSALDTTRLVHEMNGAIKDVAQGVESLASSAEESSSSILEMTATNDEVGENIGELAGSVRETVSSIEEMAYSIKEVAKNVDALSLTAEETSSSMNEMDVSIDQVQSNANETARLSEEVALDAEKGAEAILKTISEIYRIKESSQEAVAVISNLGSRIEAIGQIVNVIDDVAEQTNLLALNAAIIAAHVVWIANARATEAWSIELMAVCWAVVAFVFRPTREVPDFFNRDKSTKEESAVKFMMGVLLFATPEMMLGWYSESTSPPPFLIITFVFLIGWFFTIFWWRSHTYSLYARMIGTPRVAISEASGKSGTCSGVVSDPTPVQVAGRQAAIGVVTEFKTRRGNETSAKFFGNGTFVIDTSEGPISVDPSECMWASSEEERQEAMVFRHSVSRWIPVGGKIAACGRYVNYTKKGAPPLRLVSEGTNPVILFASNDIDPLRLATRIVSQRRITLLGILAVTLALSFFMVSTIKFRSFKDLKPNARTLAMLALVLGSSIVISTRFAPAFVLVWLLGCYIVLGVFETALALVTRRARTRDSVPPP